MAQILSAARSLAERARGLRAISAPLGEIGLRASGRRLALWPHTHTGVVGGQMQLCASVAMNVFTIRSSSE
jgi:hypothetical protein